MDVHVRLDLKPDTPKVARTSSTSRSRVNHLGLHAYLTCAAADPGDRSHVVVLDHRRVADAVASRGRINSRRPIESMLDAPRDGGRGIK